MLVLACSVFRSLKSFIVLKFCGSPSPMAEKLDITQRCLDSIVGRVKRLRHCIVQLLARWHYRKLITKQEIRVFSWNYWNCVEFILWICYLVKMKGHWVAAEEGEKMAKITVFQFTFLRCFVKIKVTLRLRRGFGNEGWWGEARPWLLGLLIVMALSMRSEEGLEQRSNFRDWGFFRFR